MIIDDGFILIAALLVFFIGIFFAWKTNTRWLYMISGLLWFIPIFIIDNIFIVIFSISMILFWSLQTFNKEEE